MKWASASSIPGVVAGFYDAAFLALPEEVLATTLVHHQHYFPVGVGSRRAERSLPRRRQYTAEGRAADRQERRARRRRAAARCAVLLGERPQDDARVAARAAAHGGLSQEAWQLSRQDRTHRAAGRGGKPASCWASPMRPARRRPPRGSRKPISRPTWSSSSRNCRGR